MTSSTPARRAIAPKALLRALDVDVIGATTEDPEDEVLVLADATGAAELILCAVPYLRDRDIRTAEAGETIEDKDRKLRDGICGHYAKAAEIAERRRAELGHQIPIIGMGHLFAAGGQTVEGDGVRELYLGSLAHVSAGIFPACFDCLALGQLHVPQQVGGSETLRYRGSPLPMGFGEARQAKSLCLVELSGSEASDPARRETRLPAPRASHRGLRAGNPAGQEQPRGRARPGTNGR
ncbi:hypothetical protein G3480_24610 [Thiorhodococcus mannitoliphagus]|uniref:Uncharacterized protein n=1 Tax=Thiorhodococcus mannitoliphagus TaxID=329406 RepID=A0A6P1DYN6_9GAMM|nr:hypothetical protein [Thiorhodococcus mannitoliphagus]